jgi:eukaryotic-like serine/threonine-protein kinase
MKPTEFGKYTLLERISHGGMAEVFRAKTFGAAGFERIVAIKLLLPTVASDEEFITMLIDEAKIAGQLSHANIAQIFDLGQIDGRYYIVQEYVAGRDLRFLLGHLGKARQHLAVAQACHIMLKVCEGLDYAHNKRDAQGQPLNLVHRDISPQNVIVSYEGEVKLIDFGIAKAEGRATRTLAGLVKGKFAYMSPEQIRGLPVDRRSDVFACGILLHELLSGRPLFKRDSDFETLKRARSAEIEPPSQHNALVPPELDHIVLRALTRHVDDRYQSAIALRDDLWEFVRQSENYYSRSDLSSWMRAAFEVPDGRAQTATQTDRDVLPDSLGEPPAEVTPPPTTATTATQAPGSSGRRRAAPDLDSDTDVDSEAAGTMVDPELVMRISAEALGPDALGGGDLDVTSPETPATRAPSHGDRAGREQPRPRNPAGKEARVEFKPPTRPPPIRGISSFDEETTNDRQPSPAELLYPRSNRPPAQLDPEPARSRPETTPKPLPLRPRDPPPAPTPAPMLIERAPTRDPALAETMMPGGYPPPTPAATGGPGTGPSPFDGGARPRRNDTSSPYLRLMPAGRDSAGGLVPQEAPGRDDIDPMHLELLRSSGQLPHLDGPGPAPGYPGRHAARAAAAPATAMPRSARLLLGAALLVLLGAAAASAVLGLSSGDPPAVTAPP